MILKQKIYVQESYTYEYEIPTSMDAEEIEEFIKRVHPAYSIGSQTGDKPNSVQYMVEDSEWVEIHNI